MGYWLNVFLINWAINIIVIEFFAIRKLKNVINIDEERDSKYKAFRRNDTKWYSRWWLYPTCHFMLVKFIGCFMVIFFCTFYSTVCNIGMK